MKYKIKTKTSLNKASVWCSLRIFNRDTLFQPINQIQLHSILIRFPFTSWSNLLSFTSVKFSCSVVSFLLSVIWWIPHQPHVCTCLDIRSFLLSRISPGSTGSILLGTCIKHSPNLKFVLWRHRWTRAACHGACLHQNGVLKGELQQRWRLRGGR